MFQNQFCTPISCKNPSNVDNSYIMTAVSSPNINYEKDIWTYCPYIPLETLSIKLFKRCL